MDMDRAGDHCNCYPAFSVSTFQVKVVHGCEIKKAKLKTSNLGGMIMFL